MSLCAKQQTTELTKLFYHQGMMTDKLVFYFTQDPICNRIPYKEQQADVRVLTFFMPLVRVGKEAQQTIAALKAKNLTAEQQSPYHIQFSHEKKPVQGIKLTITYNPEKVDCEYSKFDAISGFKGLTFSLYNKEVIQKLQHKEVPLLQYASYSPQKTRIVLDCGHGGVDEGKVGCFGIKEKDINMQVGRKVADLLKKKGFNVWLTRTGDQTVTLDERTTLANSLQADLFLSIHANSAHNAAVQGVETYWLNHQTCQPAMAVETAQLQPTIARYKERQGALNNLLAQQVHHQVLQATVAEHKTTDRCIKPSVTQVLLGTEMPAALIEIGFLSNPEETKYLSSSKYQTLVATGIVSGIQSFLKKYTDMKHIL